MSRARAPTVSRAALPVLRRADRALDRAFEAVGDASRTVKFLRGRADFDARPDDIFVASYPRSGTTWTQLIAYLLVSGAREFDFRHLTDVSPWWERSLARRPGAVDEFRRLASPRVFKTHLPCAWLPRGARYLYVWRSAEDVAVSYYYLYRRFLAFDGDFSEFFERFVRGDVQYKSWFRHVAGWRAHEGDPSILFIPYEEMRAEPAAWIRRIADFLGVGASDSRCEEIARASDFEAMKAAEEKFDFAQELFLQLGVREGAFLRRGEVARGEGHISPAQRRALARASSRALPWPTLEWRLPAFLH